MAQSTSFTVGPQQEPIRLDLWLAKKMKCTRAQAQRLIRHEAVLVNDSLPQKTGVIIKSGDVITWRELEKTITVVREEPVPVSDPEIIIETVDFLVINKPPGLVVHPPTDVTKKSIITASKTLAGWLLRTYPKVWNVGEYPNRPGIVHRLDKDTSGLMVIAKNQASFISLKQQFKNRSVEKKYWALAHAVVAQDHGFLDFPIGRGVDGRMVARPPLREVNLRNVMAIKPGRPALTEFLVVKRFVNYTLLDVTLHTGRTHQIRVHFFAYNHPLVGDPLYQQKAYAKDERKINLGRVFLQAYRLCFNDLKGERKEFELKMSEDLEKLLEVLV